MTLTHTLPSLRRTLADPLMRDRWPGFSTASPTDVAVAGLSLVTLVQWCGTPCVHTANAVIPGTGGCPSETDLASVIVTRVIAVDTHDHEIHVWVDAELGDSTTFVEEARMIGRASTAHGLVATVVSSASVACRVCELPADLCAGDLIAIPCPGAVRLHDVRKHAAHPERMSDDRVDHDRDEISFPSRVK